VGLDLVAADDFDAKGAGGPGEDAASLVERGDAPESGAETRLPDADAAADGERADFDALNAGDGSGPLGPAFYIEKNGPDARGRDANFDFVTKIRHDGWGPGVAARYLCAVLTGVDLVSAMAWSMSWKSLVRSTTSTNGAPLLLAVEIQMVGVCSMPMRWPSA